MILPTGAPSFSEALRMGAEVYHNLKVSELNSLARTAVDGYLESLQDCTHKLVCGFHS